VWRQADKYNVPAHLLRQQDGQAGADFYFTVRTIVSRLGAKPLRLQLPSGSETTSSGVVDLVYNAALTWRGDTARARTTRSSRAGRAWPTRSRSTAQLVETVAETDEALLEKYFGGEELTPEEIKGAIRKMVIASEIYPVLCGSAFKNKGVQPMLDAVVDYLPSPLDVPPMAATTSATRTRDHRAARHDGAVLRAGLQGRHAPVLRQAHLRPGVLGTVGAGTQVLNATKDRKEKIGRLMQMHANSREDISEVKAGDICAVIGLKQTTTGDTLAGAEKPIVSSR
jgi:elongation factor G